MNFGRSLSDSGRGDDRRMADDEPALDRYGHRRRHFRRRLLRKNTDPAPIVAPVRSRSRPRRAGFRRPHGGQHGAFQPDRRRDASTPRATGLGSGRSVFIPPPPFWRSPRLGSLRRGVSSAGYSLAVREVERGDHTAARRQLLANGTLLLAVLAPASLGIALTGNCIATTLVGSKYVSGVAPLIPWMAASSFFNCLRGTTSTMRFSSAKRPHLQIWVAGLAGIIAIGLSFYLIPKEGPIGAAIAVAATSVVTCVHCMVAGRYAYPIPLPIAAGIRVGICCAMMALVVVELPDSGWTGLVLRAGFGAAAYALAAVALNLLDSRQHAIRLAKQAARWLAAFRSAAVPRKLR